MVKKKKIVKTRRNVNYDRVPLGVKIISVIYYINAGLFALFGLLIAIGANAIVSYLVTAVPELATIKYGTLLAIGVLLGIIMIGIGVLSFFIGKGLWKLKQWARVLVLIFLVLGILSVIFSMMRSFEFANVVGIVIDVLIGGYLIFNKEVRKAFK